MKAVLNFPVDAKFFETLVEDEKDLRLMMPAAEMPFHEAQWSSTLDPAIGTLSFKVTYEEFVIGHFAFLRINPELREATLGLVYLSPKFRKSGSSRKLIELSEQIAIELLNIKTMLLNVRSHNLPAYNLYLKTGYKEYDRTDDLVRMKKTLPQL